MLIQTLLDLVFFAWLLTLSVLILRRRAVKAPSPRLLTSKTKRYIVFRVLSQGQVSQRDLDVALKGAIEQFMGSMWVALSSPRVVFFDQELREGIISTNRQGYKVVIASMHRLKRIGNQEVLVLPTKTTGSLKRAKRMIGLR